ncbi:MAG TPA: hypothetical protein VGB92_20650 [Longimicrobium sp.]|jgi:hypothetical protein
MALDIRHKAVVVHYEPHERVLDWLDDIVEVRRIPTAEVDEREVEVSGMDTRTFSPDLARFACHETLPGLVGLPLPSLERQRPAWDQEL